MFILAVDAAVKSPCQYYSILIIRPINLNPIASLSSRPKVFVELFYSFGLRTARFVGLRCFGRNICRSFSPSLSETLKSPANPPSKAAGGWKFWVPPSWKNCSDFCRCACKILSFRRCACKIVLLSSYVCDSSSFPFVCGQFGDVNAMACWANLPFVCANPLLLWLRLVSLKFNCILLVYYGDSLSLELYFTCFVSQYKSF